MTYNPSSQLSQVLSTVLADIKTVDKPLTASDVRKHLYILNKEAQLIPYHPKPAQLHFRQHKTGRDIVVKPRQIGFSTEIRGTYFTESVTSRVMCATLAHDADTTQKLRRMETRFYDNLPDSIRPARGLDNATTTTYLNTGSEVTIATAGSANIGRGGTYNRVHGSEVAFWKNARAILAGLLQGVPLNGEVILESTANGAQGYFFETVQEALHSPQDSIWTVHFYQWWWEPEYQIALEPSEVLTYSDTEQYLVDTHNLTAPQIKWRRYKIRELGDQLFLQEFPEDITTCFLTSGGGVFNLLDSHIYKGDTPRYEGNTAYMMQAHDKTARYVAGVDWGQSDDYTALSIFEIKTGQPAREVYINRWRKMNWHIIRANIIDLLKAYRVEKVIVERNSASSNIENLIHEIQDSGLQTGVQSFTMSNRSKDEIVKLMQNGLSEDGVTLLDVDYANHEMRTFETKQTATGLWAYSHPDGGHDDCVDARLLAHFAATQLWM